MEDRPTGQQPAEAGSGAAATAAIPTAFTGVKTMQVLVAIDESETSLYALRWALDNLFAGAGSAMAAICPSITLLNVQQPYQTYVYPAGPAIFATNPMIETIRKAQKENSANLLACALEVCRGRAVNAQTMIMEGDPKDMICQAVDKIHYDLLIIGSRGLGKIKRAFLGSVSDYCAHHANCPILIVKPLK